ncbi:MAG: OmpA family protein [Methylomonas sp.]|jgi:outer membrane protein OmpA-like peptidoglycan-associated protein
MKNNNYFPVFLIAAAIVSGCGSHLTPPPSLTNAHENYNYALAAPEVPKLAGLELKQASETLNKADAALKAGKDEDDVKQLAYIANQQVEIAKQTAKQKTAEQEVANATSVRDQIRLQERTAEADAAKQQLKELEAKETARGMMITMGDVLFRTGKAQLEQGGMRIVEKLADFLNQHPQYNILIEGHTDNTGKHEYNQELSERRAEAVQVALLDMAVDGARMSTRGYGDEYPVASNSTSAGRQMNRRVDIVLSDEKGNFAATR